jgi:hypothetical protein
LAGFQAENQCINNDQYDQRMLHLRMTDEILDGLSPSGCVRDVFHVRVLVGLINEADKPNILQDWSDPSTANKSQHANAQN